MLNLLFLRQVKNGMKVWEGRIFISACVLLAMQDEIAVDVINIGIYVFIYILDNSAYIFHHRFIFVSVDNYIGRLYI